MAALPPARKALGQHWLTDLPSLQAMAAAANLSREDTVLEIGPGAGHLTAVLAPIVRKVVAVEFDHTLAQALIAHLPAANVEIMEADILSFDFRTMPPDYKIVANIPYYLTSHLIRRLSELTQPPERAVLLVQAEVARRVAAKAGNMSLLSITAQFYWEVSVDRIIPAALFTPPPKVDSQILILKRPSQPLFNDIDPAAFFKLVKTGFGERRKTLLNSLSGGLGQSKPAVRQLLEKAQIDPGWRAQQLSHEDWYRLWQSSKS